MRRMLVQGAGPCSRRRLPLFLSTTYHVCHGPSTHRGVPHNIFLLSYAYRLQIPLSGGILLPIAARVLDVIPAE